MLRPFALCGLLMAAVPALAAEHVFPPGSRIGLVPPADMTVARGLTGFRSETTGAAILAIEMPADAYPALAAGFSDSALKAQGFSLKSRETVSINGKTGILMTGEQADRGRSVPKAVLLASDPTMTALVVGQLPQGASAKDINSVRTALKSVSFRAPLDMDAQLAALPFQLGERAGFRPVRTMAGNSVLLTDGPADMIAEAMQPVLIVAKAFGPRPPSEQRETFARQALLANDFVKDATLERSQSYRQGGAEWHEIVAKAKDGTSGKPVVVMQTIRFERDGYVRSVGVVRPEERDEVLPRFRKVADALQPE